MNKTHTEIDANATPKHSRPDPATRRSRRIERSQGTTMRNQWGAWVFLTIGLIVTVIASLFMKTKAESAAQREFDFTCNEIRLNIETRLDAAAQVLRSGAAFVDASGTVSREEWRIFAQRLQIDEFLPGIQGIAYVQLLPPEQLDQHVQAIRREGFPNYQVWPAGVREIYSSIIYIEPFEDRNLRAFGYDMLSEPVRRAAMERARDENTAALSSKVILAQENDQDVQAGIVMYVPVYHRGVPLETIEQRRAAIQGWVGSPYRMTDLIEGTLGGWDAKLKDMQIGLRVYDGDRLSANTLLYDTQATTDTTPIANARVTRIPVDFAGHRWTLQFAQFTQFGRPIAAVNYGNTWLVLFSGTIIALLFFWSIRSLLKIRSNAQQLREEITERMRTQHDLQVSETRYRRLFESARDGILILNAETGMILDVNPFLLELLGYSYEAFLGKKVWELGFFKDLVANEANFAELKEKGYVRYDDKALETDDGQRIEVEFISNIYLANHQKVIQCNIRDMTEHKRVAEELGNAKDSAENANRAKSQFLSSMSHELRTPLNAIIGFSEMLADKTFGELNEKQSKYVNNVLESGHYLLSLINDILDLSKVESGKMEFERSTFPLAPLIDNSLVMVKEKCMKQGITLSMDITEPIRDIEISADERMLKQILFNLLSNAVKFTTEGGSITVNARMEEESMGVWEYGSKGVDRSLRDSQSTGLSDSNTPTSPHPHTPTLLISVADTGIGIKPENHKKIFRAFEQVASSDTPKTQGTGLGLKLVKQFVELHGGQVWVESEFGKGSTFWFTIPAGPEGSEEAV